MSLELCSFVDTQKGSGEIAHDLGRGTDFDLLRAGYVATNFAAYDYRCGLDLRGHNGGLPDMEAVLGGNFPINFAIDSCRSIEGQLAADFRPAIEMGDTFARRSRDGPWSRRWLRRWCRDGRLGLRIGRRLDRLNLWTLFGLFTE